MGAYLKRLHRSLILWIYFVCFVQIKLTCTMHCDGIPQVQALQPTPSLIGVQYYRIGTASNLCALAKAKKPPLNIFKQDKT